MDHVDALCLALKVASQAGETLREGFGSVHATRLKQEGLRDIVTRWDEEVEAAAINLLRESAPEIPILSEETRAEASVTESPRFWALDPLDGTVNLAHGIPWFGVSLGLVEAGRPVLGVIHLPMSDDIYYGGEGLGAYRNHQPLRVAASRPEVGLFAAAIGNHSLGTEDRSAIWSRFGRVNDRSRGCLRTGSAVVNLTWLAEGRLQGVFGVGVRLWDCVAGLALAQAAGAEISLTIHPADPTRLDFVAAASGCAEWLATS